MSETVIEPETRGGSWWELGWNIASFIGLLLAAIGIIYGWGYAGLGEEILVPSFAALLLAVYCKLEQVLEKLNE
jgi:hypothetical protein